MMNRIYLNELSLEGQFKNLDSFFDEIKSVMKCLKYVKEQGEKIYKSSDFYGRKITPDKTWNDLRGEKSDMAKRLKSLLLSTTDSPPFWDLEEMGQDLSAMYKWNDLDVSGTSIAEGARLNFSRLEREHGFDYFEKDEICDCIRAFDRFVQLEDWNEVFQDKSLVYKRYSPSSKGKNWFLTSKYSDKQIDKFRCVNPKRCFGFRDDGIFYVLRMERDHSVSDNG